jgi:RimJ/RimL family protein N-acetyltransferase
MLMNITYRKLSPEESRKYKAIRLQCLKNFPEYFGSTYEEQITLPKLPFETYIEEQTPDKFTVGAFDREKLIGICSVSLETRKKTRHIGEIIQMYVNSAYKGKKIGLNLLQAAMQEAFSNPEIEQLKLSVVTTNASANRIYDQAGFKEYGHLKNNFKSDGQYFDQRLMVYYRSG